VFDIRTQTPQPLQRSAIGTQKDSAEKTVEIPSTSSTSPISYVFEIPKRQGSSVDIEDDEDNDDDDNIDEYARAFGRILFNEITSPYLTQYLYNTGFLLNNTVFVEITLHLGDSNLSVDNSSDNTIKRKNVQGDGGIRGDPEAQNHQYRLDLDKPSETI
jgi:hypothetical protein